jgi:NADH-quinone oxidoreductase subunit M
MDQFDWLRLALGTEAELVVRFALGLDGLNLWLVSLTLAIHLVVWGSGWVESTRPCLYHALLLLLNASLVGTFLAQDFFLFYLCYEFMLVPMYVLIGVWGGERKLYAAIKFFLYTLAGSVFLLIVLVGLGASVTEPASTAIPVESQATIPPAVPRVSPTPTAKRVYTLSLTAATDRTNYVPGSPMTLPDIRFWAFLAVALAMLIKLPVVPVHTWLPDAHVEASTPISIALAGILLKVGGYGFFKVGMLIFPEQFVAWAPYLAMVAVVSIIWGGLVALGQHHLKRMIAYSSVSHMGFALLGLASGTITGVNGGFFQLVGHGLVTALLFLLAGSLHHRTHSYYLAHYRGLTSQMPAYAGFFLFACLAGLGLPGLVSFPGELLSLAGAFDSPFIGKAFGAVAVLGLVLSAGYFLWTYQRMFTGPLQVQGSTEWLNRLHDLTHREKAIAWGLVLAIVLLGIVPGLILNVSERSVAYWVEHLHRQAALWSAS